MNHDNIKLFIWLVQMYFFKIVSKDICIISRRDLPGDAPVITSFMQGGQNTLIFTHNCVVKHFYMRMEMQKRGKVPFF